MEKRLIDANAFKEYLQKGTEENADIIPKRLVDAVLDIMEGIMLDIDEQPTINTVPRWIPREERLPEESGNYLATFSWIQKPELITVECVYFSKYSGFEDVWGWKVLAWMPLPEPYKRGGEDERSHKSD